MRDETLLQRCATVIATRYTFFRPQLQTLPVEMREQVEVKRLALNTEIFQRMQERHAAYANVSHVPVTFESFPLSLKMSIIQIHAKVTLGEKAFLSKEQQMMIEALFAFCSTIELLVERRVAMKQVELPPQQKAVISNLLIGFHNLLIMLDKEVMAKKQTSPSPTKT